MNALALGRSHIYIYIHIERECRIVLGKQWQARNSLTVGKHLPLVAVGSRQPSPFPCCVLSHNTICILDYFVCASSLWAVPG